MRFELITSCKLLKPRILCNSIGIVCQISEWWMLNMSLLILGAIDNVGRSISISSGNITPYAENCLYAVMNESQGSPINGVNYSFSITTKVDVLPPDISPITQPRPFIPFLAPSPLRPFANDSVPKLSGIVTFPFQFVSVRPCNIFFAEFLFLQILHTLWHIVVVG